MTLVAYVVATLGAALLAILLRSRPAAAAAVGCVGLAVAFVLALVMSDSEVLTIGGSVLASSPFLRLFLVLGGLVGLFLAVSGILSGSRPDVPGVTLGILGSSALALALPDARLAILAATAGGLLGVFTALVPRAARSGATVGIREVRAVVVAATMAIAAAAWIGRDLSELVAQPVVFGLGYLAFALAAAIRFGAIPFHLWAARMTDIVPDTALPVLTAWGPAAFAVVTLAWIDGSVAPLLVDLGIERTLVLGVAVASIVLAAVAAWIQDDIEHVVGYSIVGDAGVVMLGLAALDPEAWAPTRIWVLAFVVTRSAFAAWAGALRSAMGTGRIADQRGWVTRAPLLAVAFGLIVVASIGLPGLAAFDARIMLVDLAIGGPVGFLVILATFAPLAYYGRLFAVGLARPSATEEGVAGTAARPHPWRPRLEALDLTDVLGWTRRSLDANRVFATAAIAVLLSTLALATSAGAFGGPAAAEAPPPAQEAPIGSFQPGPIESIGPASAEPEIEPSAVEPSEAVPSEAVPSEAVPSE